MCYVSHVVCILVLLCLEWPVDLMRPTRLNRQSHNYSKLNSFGRMGDQGDVTKPKQVIEPAAEERLSMLNKPALNKDLLEGHSHSAYDSYVLDLEPAEEHSETFDTSEASGGETDGEIAKIKEQIQAVKVSNKEKARFKRKAKKHAELAKLKAELAQLMESSEDEDLGLSIPKVQVQKVRFRSSKPGPAEVREAMDAQAKSQELHATAMRAGDYPPFSVLPHAVSGDTSTPAFLTHHGGVFGDTADCESIASSQEVQIAGERAPRFSKKSGIMMRASDRVDEPQLWPHVALKGEFLAQNLSFHDLDFRSFVSGELEIITSPYLALNERQGRLHLLKELIYLSRGYEWEVIRNVYASVVSKIEIRALSWAQWGSEFTHQIQFALVRQQMDKGQSQVRRKPSAKSVKSAEPEAGTYFCREFNQSSCTKGDSHSSTYKGKRVTVLHICAKCWLSDRVRKAHNERDAACPRKQES